MGSLYRRHGNGVSAERGICNGGFLPCCQFVYIAIDGHARNTRIMSCESFVWIFILRPFRKLHGRPIKATRANFCLQATHARKKLHLQLLEKLQVQLFETPKNSGNFNIFIRETKSCRCNFPNVASATFFCMCIFFVAGG